MGLGLLSFVDDNITLMMKFRHLQDENPQLQPHKIFSIFIYLLIYCYLT